MNFFRDTRHLWILSAVIVPAVGVGLLVRARLVPEDFGRQGPYRAAALTEIAAKPSVFQADSVCHQCHQKVQEERAESLHQAVSCAHCHGTGREHVELARKAADSGAELPHAAAWDGDFRTKVDLFITRDRRICLSCHASVVGMPANFKKIDVAKHLEEQGAAEPASAETCFECHGGHNTKP